MADQPQQSSGQEVAKQTWKEQVEKVEERHDVLKQLWERKREAIAFGEDLQQEYDRISEAVGSMKEGDENMAQAKTLLKEIDGLIKSVEGVIEAIDAQAGSFVERGKEALVEAERQGKPEFVAASFSDAKEFFVHEDGKDVSVAVKSIKKTRRGIAVTFSRSEGGADIVVKSKKDWNKLAIRPKEEKSKKKKAATAPKSTKRSVEVAVDPTEKEESLDRARLSDGREVHVGEIVLYTSAHAKKTAEGPAEYEIQKIIKNPDGSITIRVKDMERGIKTGLSEETFIERTTEQEPAAPVPSKKIEPPPASPAVKSAPAPDAKRQKKDAELEPTEAELADAARVIEDAAASGRAFKLGGIVDLVRIEKVEPMPYREGRFISIKLSTGKTLSYPKEKEIMLLAKAAREAAASPLEPGNKEPAMPEPKTGGQEQEETWEQVIGQTYRLYSEEQGYPEDGLEVTAASAKKDDVTLVPTDPVYGEFDIPKQTFLKFLQSKDPKESLQYVESSVETEESKEDQGEKTEAAIRDILQDAEISALLDEIDKKAKAVGGPGSFDRAALESNLKTGLWNEPLLLEGSNEIKEGIKKSMRDHILFLDTAESRKKLSDLAASVAARHAFDWGDMRGRLVVNSDLGGGSATFQGVGKDSGKVIEFYYKDADFDTRVKEIAAAAAEEKKKRETAQKELQEKREQEAVLRQAMDTLQYKGFWKKKWAGLKREPIVEDPVHVLYFNMDVDEDEAFRILMKLEQQGKIRVSAYADNTHPSAIEILQTEKEAEPAYELAPGDVLDIVGNERLQRTLESVLDTFAKNAGDIDAVRARLNTLFDNLPEGQQKLLDERLAEKNTDFDAFVYQWETILADRVASGLQYYILASLERDVSSDEELKSFEEQIQPKAGWKRNLIRGAKAALPAFLAGVGTAALTGGIGSVVGLAAGFTGALSFRRGQRKDLAGETEEAKKQIEEKRKEAVAAAQERFLKRMQAEGGDVLAAYLSSLLKEQTSMHEEDVYTSVLNNIRKEAEKRAPSDPETQAKTMEYLLAALEMKSPVGKNSAFNQKAAKMGNVRRAFSEAWTAFKGGQLRDLWKHDENKWKRGLGDVLNAGVAGTTGAFIGMAAGSMALKAGVRGGFGFGKGFSRTFLAGKAEVGRAVREEETHTVDTLLEETRESVRSLLEKGSADSDDLANLQEKNIELHVYLQDTKMLAQAPELRAEIEAAIQSIETTGAMYNMLAALEHDLDDKRATLEDILNDRLKSFEAGKDTGKLKAVWQGIKEGTLVASLGFAVDTVRDLDVVKETIQDIREWVHDIFSSSEKEHVAAMTTGAASRAAGPAAPTVPKVETPAVGSGAQAAEQAAPAPPSAPVASKAEAAPAPVETTRSAKTPTVPRAIASGLATQDSEGKIVPKEGFMLVQDTRGNMTVAPDEQHEWVKAADSKNLDIKPIEEVKASEAPKGPRRVGETHTLQELKRSSLYGAEKSLREMYMSGANEQKYLEAIEKEYPDWVKRDKDGTIVNKERIWRRWSIEQAKVHKQWFDKKGQYFETRIYKSTEVSLVVDENGYPRVVLDKYKDLGYQLYKPRAVVHEALSERSSGGGAPGEAESAKAREQEAFEAAKKRFAGAKEDWLSEKQAAEQAIEQKASAIAEHSDTQFYARASQAAFGAEEGNTFIKNFSREYVESHPGFDTKSGKDIDAFREALSNRLRREIVKHEQALDAARLKQQAETLPAPQRTPAAAPPESAPPEKKPETIAPPPAPASEAPPSEPPAAKKTSQTKTPAPPASSKKIPASEQAPEIARATPDRPIVVGETKNGFTRISILSGRKAVDIKIPESYAATEKGAEKGNVILKIGGEPLEGEIKLVRPDGGGAPRPVLEYAIAGKKQTIEIEEASRGKIEKPIVPPVEKLPESVSPATVDDPIQIGETKKGVTPMSVWNKNEKQAMRVDLPEEYRAQKVGKQVVIQIDNVPTMGEIELRTPSGGKTPQAFLIYEIAGGKKVEMPLEKATVVGAAESGDKNRG